MKEYLMYFRLRKWARTVRHYDEQTFFTAKNNKEARKMAREIIEEALKKMWQERDKKGEKFFAASCKILDIFKLKKIKH